ncbi:MAG: NADP-dependent oxidoreductase, partial [Novosphingobium sp.]|nr:NADP-dependent oxidoreductase [Novosphingobium sp.]
MTETRQWLLNGHPRGRPINDDDLKLVTTTLPEPGPGQMLLKTHYLGFDPAQKGWMENIADYVAPMAIGDVMRGSGITEVMASNGGKYPVGTMLSGSMVWSEYLIHDGEGLIPCMPDLPPTAMLSILGTTGVTAYCGLFKVGEPVAGDVVVVSGAAGATGSIVGQLAKIAGCTVIGIAGGPEKCEWLVKEAGYDHAIDYKAGPIRAQLKELAPGGINVIFDNVGGKILNDMLACIATGARVVICGGISRYETGNLPAGPENYFNLVFRRARMQGFIVLDWAS